MFRPFVLAGAIVALNVALDLHPAAAQQSTQAQRDAIRASCRSDFMANCSGVTPGGKEALECLLRNQAKLSPACNTAVSAVVPVKPAPAATEAPATPAATPSSPAAAKGDQAPPRAEAAEPAPKSAAAPEARLKSVRQSCTLDDFMAHCSWIKPDNPELLLCLQANASDLSPACRAAVQDSPAAETPPAAPEHKATTKRTTKSKNSTVSREPASTPPAAAASASPAAAPSEAQKAAIRAACRSDFVANCSGVQPGGVEALQCLKSHATKLSAACQSAVAAIGGGAPSDAAPTASAPTPAIAPLGPIPPMRPREALAILAMCRAEQRSLCNSIPIGGGRILTCLADHAQQLSLECYQALARATR